MKAWNAITAAKIATDAIANAKIADGAITAGKIATDAIANAKIADGAITAAKIATDAISSAKIATDAITAAKIAANAIGSSELATDAIGAAQLAADAIAEVNATVDTALADIGATIARMGYLDNLNIGENVAGTSEVTAIQNNTRAVRVVPSLLERPDSGSTVFRIEIFLYDDAGNMEPPDAAPGLYRQTQSLPHKIRRQNQKPGNAVAGTNLRANSPEKLAVAMASVRSKYTLSYQEDGYRHQDQPKKQQTGEKPDFLADDILEGGRL